MAPLEITGKTLARNSLMNLVGQAIPLLIGILTIPFIIRGLGTERFGLLSLAWVILGYVTIFDLGLGRATTKYVAEYFGRGDEKQVPPLVWTAVTAQGIQGLIGAIVIAWVAPFLIERVLNIPAELREEAKAMFFVLAFGIPILLLTNSFSGVMEALQRFKLLNAIKTPSTIILFILPLVGLAFGLDLSGIVALILLSKIGVLLVFMIFTFRILPGLRKFSLSGSILLRFFRYGRWVMTTSLVGPVLVYFDRFFIGSILTIAAVAYYTAPYEVATRLAIIPASLTSTLFPAFSSLEGAGNNNRVTHLLARSIKYPLLSLGPIVIVFGVFAPEILQIWLGYDFAMQSATVLQILVIGVLINSVAQIPYALLQGVGRPDITAKIHLLQLPIYVAVVWFSVRHWGLAGAGVAWTFRVVLDAFLMLLFAFRICNLPFRSILSRDLVRTSLSLIFWAIMVYAIKYLDGYFPFPVQIFLFLTLFILFARGVWKNILDDFDRGMIIGGIKIMPGLEKLV